MAKFVYSNKAVAFLFATVDRLDGSGGKLMVVFDDHYNAKRKPNGDFRLYARLPEELTAIEEEPIRSFVVGEAVEAVFGGG